MLETRRIHIAPGRCHDTAWTYTAKGTGSSIAIDAPCFELDGQVVSCSIDGSMRQVSKRELRCGISEARFEGPVLGQHGLVLSLTVRFVEDSPFVRFRYELLSDRPRKLTKAIGADNLTYLSASLSNFSTFVEVRFSEFNELFHSFGLTEHEVGEADLANSLSFMGPMLAAKGVSGSILIAYEHGSQYPDRFLEFVPSADRAITIRAVKGNYYQNQTIQPHQPFQSIWFQLGAVDGNLDHLRMQYRQFQLTGASVNSASRKPYIFYNTWNYQERNQDWNKQTYLGSMTQERMLAEVDVAHRMGVDVFVIDTGWYEKTGDWEVSASRFPNGLRDIREKLDGYGMKLGLWFNPTVAAVSSKMAREHDDCIRSWDGRRRAPSPVWETEVSHDMCLVSRYADAFADDLIRLHHELGVTYFKWDAIGQYGCSDLNHRHGTEENSVTERSDCYAFEIGRAMASVVDRLGEACPGAIVDFDITEGGRTVGLSFLSAGKYFLINNGPYYANYDVPAPPNRNINIFFFPGQARGWICRAPLTFDRWFPSVLFLTHYFPDDPAENQWTTLASLMLGQNGIWGDLLSVSEEGIHRFGETLGRYKQIRDDITEAAPICTGSVGGALETHEKIAGNGRGLVSLFSTSSGLYSYITRHAVAEGVWNNDDVSVTRDANGRAVINARFNAPGAKIVMFGVEA